MNAKLIILAMLVCFSDVRLGMCQDRTYELTREDFTSAKPIRSINVILFGAGLGAKVEDVLRGVVSSGRPVKQDTLRPGSKSISVFYGDEKLPADRKAVVPYEADRDRNAMVVFEADKGVVTRIFVRGTPADASSLGEPPSFRGFDLLAAGNTKALLTKCGTEERVRILGLQDGSFEHRWGTSTVTEYVYDNTGLTVFWERETFWPPRESRFPRTESYCWLLFTK